MIFKSRKPNSDSAKADSKPSATQGQNFSMVSSDETPLARSGGKPRGIVVGGKRVAPSPGHPVLRASRQVDVCFVFDTTGSMSNKIDGLVACMDELVADLAKLNLEWRVTTVPFGDLTVRGDRIIEDQPFVNSVNVASSQLRTMPRFSGGGNAGESAVEAMTSACLKVYRASAVKVLVLITDEPALGNQQMFDSIHARLDALDAICFTVAPDTPYYREWAARHGGTWHLVGQRFSTSEILNMFKSLLRDVADVADAVHRIGGGSVKAYLERGD